MKVYRYIIFGYTHKWPQIISGTLALVLPITAIMPITNPMPCTSVVTPCFPHWSSSVLGGQLLEAAHNCECVSYYCSLSPHSHTALTPQSCDRPKGQDHNLSGKPPIMAQPRPDIASLLAVTNLTPSCHKPDSLLSQASLAPHPFHSWIDIGRRWRRTTTTRSQLMIQHVLRPTHAPWPLRPRCGAMWRGTRGVTVM